MEKTRGSPAELSGNEKGPRLADARESSQRSVIACDALAGRQVACGQVSTVTTGRSPRCVNQRLVWIDAVRQLDLGLRNDRRMNDGWNSTLDERLTGSVRGLLLVTRFVYSFDAEAVR